VSTTHAPEAPPAPDAPVRSGPGASSTLSRAVRYAGMPVFLAVVLGALFLYVQGVDLDRTAQRALSAERLVAQTLRHIWLAGLSTVFVILIAMPLGILSTRESARRLKPLFIGLANAGQAIPSLGFITLIVLTIGTGVRGVVVGLVAYSALPILRNTIAGLEAVDRSLLESARGMGMSRLQVLRRIELPLSVPVIVAGVRVALILNVGTAALAFLFGAGGLGDTIFTGYQLNRTPVLVTGAVLVSALALAIDHLAGVAEDLLTPRGL
jgi:osmoprotectant transport system permease protein